MRYSVEHFGNYAVNINYTKLKICNNRPGFFLYGMIKWVSINMKKSWTFRAFYDSIYLYQIGKEL